MLFFRVRPLNNREKKANDPSVVQFPGNGQILVRLQQITCIKELNLISVIFLFHSLCFFHFSHSRKQCNGGQKPKLFGYNVVFEPGASQNDVLEYSGIKRIIEMAIEGFSCTAFCYGQTGSGKTHTLTGPPELVI